MLADEINRASPRTQSALLEAMGESQVSIDGELRRLSELFFVIATENPVEFRGTYPLPEAQMDRFAMRFVLGYVEPEQEVSILAAQPTSIRWRRCNRASRWRRWSCSSRPRSRCASAMN